MNNTRTWHLKKIGLLLGPLVFITILLLPEIQVLGYPAQKVIAILGWMLTWWISEAVSLSVTALLPIVLLPLMGVMSIREVTSPYASPIIYLFMGGFMIALAMEKWNLHLRIALSVVKLTGTRPDGIVFGFMVATAFLSMWISNTATTVMMLPIASSVITLLLKQQVTPDKRTAFFSLTMMLGIAYAANIGGIATLIGTPPNSVLAGYILEAYQIEIGFAQWMLMGIPFSVVFLLITYFMLVKVVFPNKLEKLEGSQELISKELEKLGPISKQEKIVLLIFSSIATLWIMRSFLNDWFPGLGLSDAGIAIAGSLALFVTPSNWQKGELILDWKDTEKLPWGILILFGGGLSLATGLSKTGIIDLVGNAVAGAGSWNIFLLLTLLMVFMTEVMSNVALTTIFIPVVAGIALGLDSNMLLFTIPVTIGASCAFMLPMATPPNAIVFASGHVRIPQMVKAGLLLNLLGIGLLALFSKTLIPWVFG